MERESSAGSPERRDFFLSYTGVDQQWAEWIALQLEEAGYTLPWWWYEKSVPT